MQFCDWLFLCENNLENLYNSTVNAFPRTTKRQHATGPVQIQEINWTPYMGMNTLFIKGIALGETGKEYSPMLLFKGVSYHLNKDQSGLIEINHNGQHFIFEKLNEKTQVLIRCNCGDFRWRFNFFDHLDQSLYGRVARKYEAKLNPGSANPLELPGMCKHVIKLVQTLEQAGVIGQT